MVTPRDVHASKKKTIILPQKFTKLEPFRANLFSVENLLISDWKLFYKRFKRFSEFLQQTKTFLAYVALRWLVWLLSVTYQCSALVLKRGLKKDWIYFFQSSCRQENGCTWDCGWPKIVKKGSDWKEDPPPSPPIYLTKWKITIYLITLFLPHLSLGGRHVLKLGHGLYTLTFTGHTWGLLSLPMLHSWFLELLHAHPYTTHHCVSTSFV